MEYKKVRLGDYLLGYDEINKDEKINIEIKTLIFFFIIPPKIFSHPRALEWLKVNYFVAR